MLFSLSCASGGLAPKEPNPPKYAQNHLQHSILQHAEKSTVALVFVARPNKPYCTAVWVSPTYILTAHHCVASAAKVMGKLAAKDAGKDDWMDAPALPLIGLDIHYYSQPEAGDNIFSPPTAFHLGKVTALDKAHDLALIKAQGHAIAPHEVALLADADNLPNIGDKLYLVGHPGGLTFTHVEATLSAYRPDFEKDKDDDEDDARKGPYLQVSGHVWFGNSGGGAFNSDGLLVGIASFIMQVPSTGFYIHPVSIKEFLKSQNVL